MLLELLLLHFLQGLLQGGEEGLDPLVQIVRVSVGLDDHAETLSSIGSPDSTEDDVAELLLGSQLVVAVLVDDLTEELQQHVVPGLLKATLIVVLDAAAPVDTVGGGEDTA